jgi:hypothetical protein
MGVSDLESSMTYIALRWLFESLPGRVNTSLPCLPLHMFVEEIIPTFSICEMYIGLCLPKALTLA